MHKLRVFLFKTYHLIKRKKCSNIVRQICKDLWKCERKGMKEMSPLQSVYGFGTVLYLDK